jgi:hypothetical protein
MGIAWRDMEVVNLPSGQPEMRLTGWAAARLAAMTPPPDRGGRACRGAGRVAGVARAPGAG